jgi:two-component system LytT family response regulator
MEMPNELGLNILNKVSEVNFEIIVTTAHKNYGIDAIKAGVFDYILKPIDIDELDIAISKIELKK